MSTPNIPIFLDGKKISSDQLIACADLGEGVNVFESLRAYNGVIFRLERHLDRLADSARTAGLTLPKSRDQIRKEIKACAALFGKKDIFIRLTVDAKNSILFFLDRKRPASVYETGIVLKTAVTRRSPSQSSPPQAKTSAFFNSVLAVMEEELGVGPRPEAIFLDHYGFVTEGTAWNIFMVKDGKLVTPETGILNGVTREFVIECAVKEKIPVSETTLTRHDIWNADEAFLTNTSGEIVPVRMLDGRTIGKSMPGKYTKQLMVRFKRELKKELGLR